jgi:hypothetical protein
MLRKIVRRCLHCRREMEVPESTYSQNAYCKHCLPERQKAAARSRKGLKWVGKGDYAVPVKAC